MCVRVCVCVCVCVCVSEYEHRRRAHPSLCLSICIMCVYVTEYDGAFSIGNIGLIVEALLIHNYNPRTIDGSSSHRVLS